MNNGLYRELQRKIRGLKTASGSGQDDLYSSVSFDSYLGGPLSMSKRAYVQGTPEQLASLTAAMIDLLAVLRAQYWIFQNAHWQTQGSTFYGDHLLFQRLYEEVSEDVDGLAEMAVGYLGCEKVDASQLISIAQKYVDEWCAEENPVARCLSAENTFLRLAKAYYDLLKTTGVLTLGLDDEIMALSNRHDSHVYLLQQRLESLKFANKKAKQVRASARKLIRLSSLGDLSGFLRVSNDVLIRKCEKDLWKVTKDADGNSVIEKLYDGDILNY